MRAEISFALRSSLYALRLIKLFLLCPADRSPGAFFRANAAPLAMIIIDFPMSLSGVHPDSDIRAVIVTLVAEGTNPAVEAPFCGRDCFSGAESSVRRCRFDASDFGEARCIQILEADGFMNRSSISFLRCGAIGLKREGSQSPHSQALTCLMDTA